ncbi:transposable element Tcb2 transposase [Trichonephila clavipes]|nr:transposable element Tcb2 transposase [Trichonephila clavipes]
MSLRGHLRKVSPANWQERAHSYHPSTAIFLRDRKRSHTTILCENDRGQSAVKQLKRYPNRTNGLEGCTVYLLRQKLWELGWEVLMHPPYSLDRTPSDYHLFLALQNFLIDKKLGSREDCENRLLKFFANKDHDFFKKDHRFQTEERKCKNERKTTPRTDKIIIRNGKIKGRKTITDLRRRNLLDYCVEISTAIVRKRLMKVGRKEAKPMKKQNSNSKDDENTFSMGQKNTNHGLLTTGRSNDVTETVRQREVWDPKPDLTKFGNNVLWALHNILNPPSPLKAVLRGSTGTTVSRQTVYRRLGHIRLYARRPDRCAPLTATHCRLRLTWNREHALWTPQQWSCVMFSDESRVSLQSDSRRTLIWRAPGTRYHQENTIERHRYGGAEWLVWGGIILGSRTDLHVQSVTMTGHIYRDFILEQHVRLFRGAMGAEFLFMDDNARPHRANIVDECLRSEDITRMDWPAYSPDLNPIEHVWDMLGRRIAARQPPFTRIPELWRALLDEWCNIPQDEFDNLILSMPKRCKACIASLERHTPY